MASLKSLFLIFIALFLLGATASTRPRNPLSQTDAVLDGQRIINIVDDFLTFWDQAKGRKLRAQRKLFAALVEANHRDYFERAIYRNASEQERRVMLDQFLTQVPPHIAAIRQFNRTIEDEIRLNLSNFKYRFPEYHQQHDIYLGLSLFLFDGSVRAVQNDAGMPDTLCLSAEVLCDYSVEQLQVTITHEIFHLYHFSFLFAESSPAQLRTGHIPLIAEGLSVAGTESVYPFQPMALYLHFTEKEVAEQREELAVNARRFLELLKAGAGADTYGDWFTDTPKEDVPKRGGYLLGYEVAHRLLMMFTFEQVCRMSPERLREHVEEQLKAIASERVLLIANCSG